MYGHFSGRLKSCVVVSDSLKVVQIFFGKVCGGIKRSAMMIGLAGNEFLKVRRPDGLRFL